VLGRLAGAPLPEGVRWLAMAADLDIVVPGLRSVPPHSEVQAIRFSGMGHLGMLLSARVIGRIVTELSTPREATDSAALAREFRSAS
jgi:triacylglycerol lipase